jgi:hypothetical protein
MYIMRYDKQDWLLILLITAAAVFNNERAIRAARRRDAELQEMAERNYAISLRAIENQERPRWLKKADEEKSERV